MTIYEALMFAVSFAGLIVSVLMAVISFTKKNNPPLHRPSVVG